jgi:Uri superfamily endonuclease
MLQLDQPVSGLQVGRLGSFHFSAGTYLYVGSAFGPGGLPARLSHHERREKTHPHWHIDYLRACARLHEAWTVVGQRMECRWCTALAAEPGVTMPVEGFGAGDTGCRSHLFYLPCQPRPSLLSRIILTSLVAEEGPLEVLAEVHIFDN